MPRSASLCLLPFLLLSLVPSASLLSQGTESKRSSLLIRDVCRLKGQEENTLTGLGLVVGLKGTGDGESGPTSRSLARAMQLMGGQIGVDPKGMIQTKELKDAKNVATVFVTVNIPGRGAQQGDRIDCTVSAISAKSLEGGTLLLTPLLGPRVDRPTIYGLAQGQIVLPDPKMPTSAKISGGCKMEATVLNEFVQGDKMTLVLEPSQSSFSTAVLIEEAINDMYTTTSQGAGNQRTNVVSEHIAKAKDQMHVEVKVPQHYRENPVTWASTILEIPLNNFQTQKRVVIQERTGVIVIGDDVTIAPVAITHKNLSISSKANSDRFVGLTPKEELASQPKLKHLVDSLNMLAVPNEDVIAIIKALKHHGNLYGELVIE